MTLLDSLLDAIVRLDGDALVMHVGEKPYVVTTSSAMNAYRGPLAWGQVELSSRVLTPDAVLGMVTQILPPDQRHALEDIGAIEHEIPSPAGVRDRFTVVAARGGDDIWLELRRHPVAEPAQAETPQVMADSEATQTAAAAAESATTAVGLQEPPAPPDAAEPPAAAAAAPEEPPAIAPESVEHARVPVIDEVSEHAPEHVEHIVIPVTSGGDSVLEDEPELTIVIEEEEEEEKTAPAEAARDEVADLAPETQEEAPFEIVEPEAQHAPTEADVDAMLAATAAALLSANVEPEDRRSDAAGMDASDVATPEFLEVVIDDEVEQEATSAMGDAADIDEPMELTAELDEIAAAPRSVPFVAPEAATPAEPDLAAAAESEAATIVDPEVATIVEPEVVTVAEPEAATMVEPEVVTVAESEEESVVITVPDDAHVEPEPVAIEQIEEIAAAPEPSPAPQSEPEPEPQPAIEPEVAPELAVAPTEQVTPEIAVEQPTSSPFPDPAEATAHAAPSPAGMPGGAYVHKEVQPADAQPRIAASVPESSQAARVVVPIGDRTARAEKPGAGARVDDQILLQILDQAARRGATTVYVVAQSRPMVRVEGEIGPLENIPALSAADIERLVATLSPGRTSQALAEGQEWISEVPQIGRVRCVTFKDHRGPGLIFRISSTLTISADHLNLPAEIRELSMQSDGLVLVTGARASGKSTLLNSLVDLINATRSDHMIAIESEIAFVHESRKSFVSQREVPDESAARAAAVTAALREDPDVLVIEDVHTSDVARAVLDAASSGRLVLASITAPSSAAAIESLIDLLPAENRAQARTTLASALRGVVGQVLLRRAAGGRTTARELLLNSPAVSAMSKDGRTAELAREQQNGQKFGMIPLAESLSALVRSGAVHPAEAYRRAPDRAALLATLAREGVDTSFAERLA